MAAAVAAFPYLLTGLGVTKFGFFMIAWTLVGYMNLFDFGFGRALTKAIAERDSESLEDTSGLVWYTLAVLFLVSGVAVVALLLLAPLIPQMLSVPSELRSEVASACRVLALSIPLMTTTSALRGVLEGYRRFGLLAAIRVPTGVVSAAAPVFVLPFTSNLVAVVSALVAMRVVTFITYLIACLRVEPTIRSPRIPSVEGFGALLRFGGWVTVSNVVGPIMVTMDRFILGGISGVAAVSFYVAPYEALTRLLVFVTSLTTVLFPAIALANRVRRYDGQRLFREGSRVTFALLFPVCIALLALGPELLSWWMGTEFASQAINVWRWLCLGLFLNGLAQSPFTFLQATGRPKATALLHLLELLPFVVLLLLLIPTFGASGAAAAWAIRAGIDYIALTVLAWRNEARAAGQEVAFVTVAACLFVPLFWDATIIFRVLVMILICMTFLPVAWRWLLTSSQREYVLRRISWGRSLEL